MNAQNMESKKVNVDKETECKALRGAVGAVTENVMSLTSALNETLKVRNKLQEHMKDEDGDPDWRNLYLSEKAAFEAYANFVVRFSGAYTDIMTELREVLFGKDGTEGGE